MPRNLRLETRFFLECLAEASLDATELLLRPAFIKLAPGHGCGDDNFERKLRLLARRGIIELPRATDRRIIRLTELGRSSITPAVDPDQQWGRPWDGIWRFVLFDVAEHDRKLRDRLRRELAATRLGYLQGSVWVTPDPLAGLRQTISSLTADPEALLFIEGRPCAGERDAAIVAGAWNFARINEAYRKYLRIHDTIPAPADSSQQWRLWLAAEREGWQEAAAIDPFLPERLLPSDYLGRKAVRARRKALRTLAAHYFAAPAAAHRSPSP